MEGFITTRASNNIENAEKLHSVVVYESHKSTKKKDNGTAEIAKKRKNSDDEANPAESEPKMDERTRQEKEMKRYRYEIIKFGMSALEKKDAKHAKIDLAISLGAKPPKNKRKNYKKVIAERKISAAQEAKRLKFASGFNSSQLKMKRKSKVVSKSNKTKHKKSNGILDVYGKVSKTKVSDKKSKKAKQ